MARPFKHWRELTSYSQAELAVHSDTSVASIQVIEQRKRPISLKIAQPILEVINTRLLETKRIKRPLTFKDVEEFQHLAEHEESDEEEEPALQYAS